MQVLPQDVDSQYGIAQSPIGPSPSQSPLAFQPFGPAPSAPLSAYTSALARSASASGSGNLSRQSKSPSDNKATATATATAPGGGAAAAAAAPAAEQGEVALGVAVLGGSPRGGAHKEPMGVTPPSEEDGTSLRSVTSSTAQTDTLAEEAQAAWASEQPVSFSSEMESTASRPAAAPQDPDLVQVQEGSAITAVTSQSTEQQPTDSSQNSAQAAGAEAADESQAAAPPSKTELQQSMKAVLSGEDQAMQASLAAANAAGGEQVKDMGVPSPSSSSHLQEGMALPKQILYASTCQWHVCNKGWGLLATPLIEADRPTLLAPQPNRRAILPRVHLACNLHDPVLV